MDCESRPGVGVVVTGEGGSAPSSKWPTGGPSGRERVKGMQGTSKEGVEFSGSEFKEFGFLEEGDVGGGGQEFSKNVVTFLSVTKTTDIPKTQKESSTHDPQSTHNIL